MAVAPTDFRIDVAPDGDGATRLTVRGELDIATAGRLREALASHRSAHLAVRLDLSQIGFVDSSGLAVLIEAKRQSLQNGWAFDIAPLLAAPVQRAIELAGIQTYLWR